MKTLYCFVALLIIFNMFLAWRYFRRNGQKSFTIEGEPIFPPNVPFPNNLLVDDCQMILMAHEVYQKIPHVSEVDFKLLKKGDRVRLEPDEHGWHLITTLESIGDDGTPILTVSRVCFIK